MVLLAVPAFMLLWLNVHSLRRLWFGSPAASSSAITTNAEELAKALERRTSELAQAALSDAELHDAVRSGSESSSARRRFRAVIAGVRQRHPVVRNIFIVRNGTVEFPSVTASASSSRAQYGAEPDLDELDMARALQQRLRQRTPTGRRENAPQEITEKPGLFAFAFAGRSNYQSYYTTVSREHGDKVLLGLTVDLDWLEQSVCPELGIGGAFELGYTRDAVARTVSTPFKTAFPFWNLRPATAAARESAAHLETMVAMSSEVLAAILCLGLFAVHRHVAREREMTRVRSEFVSGVSHELRTPITVIRLYSETLMECPDLQSDGREYCEIISAEAQRLDRLVEGVLNVSAIERGLSAYNLKECDIGYLTTQTLAHVRRYYHYKGYTVSEDVARDLPPVKADVEAFKSALLNLVDNAIKYSNSCHVVTVRAYRSGGAVVVAVEDCGIGIAPDAIEKIFDPFYRADNAGAHGGCGLGLYLVRHIMTAHGGDVRVRSEVGSGSRFELVFPAVRKPSSGKEGAESGAVAAAV